MTHATTSDLVRLASLGYELEVNTAMLAALWFSKRPEQLNATECRILIYQLEREKSNRG
jgi:hypothetical protein